MLSKHTATVIKIAVLLLCSHTSAYAGHFSFAGNFTHDNDVQFFNFVLSTDSPAVSIKTFSLNGGTNAAGDSVAGGGFNPYLALYDQSTGAWLFDTSAKSATAEASISNANLYGPLSAGHYILALTQMDNIAIDIYLSAGFAADIGLASFAESPFTTQGGGGSGHWALDILNVDQASLTMALVSTPNAWALMLVGLAGWSVTVRQRLKPLLRRRLNFSSSV